MAGIAGAFCLQTVGVPEQFHPAVTLQPMHPAEGVVPVSHCSFPATMPSPHSAEHDPKELATNPGLVQVRQILSDRQVLQSPLQGRQPYSSSK